MLKHKILFILFILFITLLTNASAQDYYKTICFADDGTAPNGGCNLYKARENTTVPMNDANWSNSFDSNGSVTRNGTHAILIPDSSGCSGFSCAPTHTWHGTVTWQHWEVVEHNVNVQSGSDLESPGDEGCGFFLDLRNNVGAGINSTLNGVAVRRNSGNYMHLQQFTVLPTTSNADRFNMPGVMNLTNFTSYYISNGTLVGGNGLGETSGGGSNFHGRDHDFLNSPIRLTNGLHNWFKTQERCIFWNYTETIWMLTNDTINSSNNDSSFYIDVGGPGTYEDADGNTWESDSSYLTGGVSTSSTGDPISGTTDDTLYQTERYGTQLHAIPTGNGTFNVTLKYAEIFFNAAAARVFDVYLEGTQVLDNLDIYDEVGHDTALDYSFLVNVTDGTLNINHTTVTDNAKISAMKIANASLGPPAPATTNYSVKILQPGTPNPQSVVAEQNATLNFTFQVNQTNITNAALLAIVNWSVGGKTVQIINYSSQAASTPATSTIKSVQHGISTIAASSASTTATITSVNTSSAFLLFGINVDDADATDYLVRGNITSATGLIFTREGTGAAVTITWHVVEFTDGVVVQRGHDASQNTGLDDHTISSVNVSSSFPLFSWQNDGGTLGGDDMISGRISNPTTFTTDSQDSTLNKLDFQIVSYRGAKIQNGSVDWTDTEEDVTLGTAVDLNKSFAFITYRTSINSNIEPDNGAIMANLTSSTNLKLTRAVGVAINATWYVVTFTGGETVQCTPVQFGTGDTEIDVTISSVNVSRSVPMISGSYWMQGRTAYTAADNFGPANIRANLTSSTNVRLTRAITGTAALDAQVCVVQFGESSGGAAGGGQQFSCSSGGKCQVNGTLPSGLQGLQNSVLSVNYTPDGQVYNNTNLSNFQFPGGNVTLGVWVYDLVDDSFETGPLSLGFTVVTVSNGTYSNSWNAWPFNASLYPGVYNVTFSPTGSTFVSNYSTLSISSATNHTFYIYAGIGNITARSIVSRTAISTFNATWAQPNSDTGFELDKRNASVNTNQTVYLYYCTGLCQTHWNVTKAGYWSQLDLPHVVSTVAAGDVLQFQENLSNDNLTIAARNSTGHAIAFNYSIGNATLAYAASGSTSTNATILFEQGAGVQVNISSAGYLNFTGTLVGNATTQIYLAVLDKITINQAPSISIVAYSTPVLDNRTDRNWTINYTVSEPDGNNTYNESWYCINGKCPTACYGFNVNNGTTTTNLCGISNVTVDTAGAIWTPGGGVDGSPVMVKDGTSNNNQPIDIYDLFDSTNPDSFSIGVTFTPYEGILNQTTFQKLYINLNSSVCGFFLEQDSNNLYLAIRNGTTSSTIIHYPNEYPAKNVAARLLVTKNGTNWTIYADGIKDESKEITNFCLQYVNKALELFQSTNGSLDDFRFYPWALTSDEALLEAQMLGKGVPSTATRWGDTITWHAYATDTALYSGEATATGFVYGIPPSVAFNTPTELTGAFIRDLIRNQTHFNLSINTSEDKEVSWSVFNWNGDNVTIDNEHVVLNMRLEGNGNDSSRKGITSVLTSFGGSYGFIPGPNGQMFSSKPGNYTAMTSGTYHLMNEPVTVNGNSTIEFAVRFHNLSHSWTGASAFRNGFAAIACWSAGCYDSEISLKHDDIDFQDDAGNYHTINGPSGFFVNDTFYYVTIKLNETGTYAVINGEEFGTPASAFNNNTLTIDSIGRGYAGDFLFGEILYFRMLNNTQLTTDQIVARQRIDMGIHEGNLTPAGRGSYTYYACANDTEGLWGCTETRTFDVLGYADFNLSFGPDVSFFRLNGCGPDKVNVSSMPQGQNSTHGIDYVCNNGTGDGSLYAALEDLPAAGWELRASNDSLATQTNLTNGTFRPVYSNFTVGSCVYVWYNATCNAASSNIRTYEIYNATQEGP